MKMCPIRGLSDTLHLGARAYEQPAEVEHAGPQAGQWARGAPAGTPPSRCSRPRPGVPCPPGVGEHHRLFAPQVPEVTPARCRAVLGYCCHLLCRVSQTELFPSISCALFSLHSCDILVESVTERLCPRHPGPICQLLPLIS